MLPMLAVGWKLQRWGAMKQLTRCYLGTLCWQTMLKKVRTHCVCFIIH